MPEIAAPAKAAPPPKEVAVKAPDGSLYTVPASELSQLPEGADLATPADIRQSELQAKYGGAGGVATATAAGLGRGLTFGLSDQVIAGVGGQSAREKLAGYQEANPVASTTGELVGIAAPLVLSGGAGAAVEGASLATRGAELAATGVRTAGMLPRGVAALGRGIESGAAHVLGEGMVGRAVASGMGAAAEGAAYGIGHEVSESAIQDHELTAEKLIAAGGKGALFGFGAGAGLSVAGSVIGAGVRKAGEAISEHMGGTSLADYLESKSGEFAFRAAGGGKGIAKRADDFAGGFEQVGKIWKEEAPGLAGKRAFAQMTKGDLSVAAANGLEREGTKLSKVLTTVDEKAAVAGSLPLAKDAVGDIEAVISKLGERAGNGPAISKLQAFSDDVKRLTGMLDDQGRLAVDAADKTLSFQQLRDFRVDADKLWKGSKSAPDLVGTSKNFGDVRDALEKRLTNGVEQYGGKALRTTYENAKQKAQAFYLLQDATKNASAAQGSNAFVSLTDKLGFHAGSVVGGMLGGPVGSAVGAGIGGAINKFGRERGSFIAADVLGRASKLNAIQAATKRVDERISEGVKDFLASGKSAQRAALADTRARRSREELIEQARGIAAMDGNPAAVQKHIEHAIGDMGFAPSISARMATKLSASYSFLASQAPKMRTNASSLTPKLEKLRVSDAELDKFGVALDALEDPLSVFTDMKHGKLPRAKIDAIKQHSERIFELMREELREQVAKHGKELTWEQKKQITILFGFPADDALAPDFTARLQATKQATPDKKPDDASQKLGGRRPIKLDSSAYATQAESLK